MSFSVAQRFSPREPAAELGRSPALRLEVDMRSYQLVPELGSPKTPWLLDWDTECFVLRDANGETVVETDTAAAHLIIDLSQTFIDGTICIAVPPEVLRFKRNSAAEAGLRKLVETAIARDPVYRAAMRQRSLRAMKFGPLLFVVAGGLFGVFCWYAIAAPEPPADHWIRYVRGLMKWSLTVLVAVALLGLGLSCSGFCQWLRIRRIERQSNLAENETD
jgi:hypothetical protein